jgi:hypothetical protein
MKNRTMYSSAIAAIAMLVMLCSLPVQAQVPMTKSTDVPECQVLVDSLSPAGQYTPDALDWFVYEVRRVYSLVFIEILKRDCGEFSAKKRQDLLQQHTQAYLNAVKECQHDGGKNCDSTSLPKTNLSSSFKPPVRLAVEKVTPPTLQPVATAGYDCEAMKQLVIATKIPSQASVTASTETVMFMTKMAIDMIDHRCPMEPGVTDAQIVAARQTYQEQFITAQNACNAVQSGERRCSARNYFGPGSKTLAVEPKNTAAPRETRGPVYPCEVLDGSATRDYGPDVITAYDPVTGKGSCQRIFRAGQSLESGSATGKSSRTPIVPKDNRTCRNCTAN